MTIISEILLLNQGGKTVKKDFIETTYRAWEDANNQAAPEVDESIEILRKKIATFRGSFIEDKNLLAIDDLVLDAQADIHRKGFYTGFEVACSILREMVSSNDK